MMQIFFNTVLFCMSEVFQSLSFSDFNGTSLTFFSARSEGPSPAPAVTVHEHHPGRAAAGRAGFWQTKTSLMGLTQQKDEPRAQENTEKSSADVGSHKGMFSPKFPDFHRAEGLQRVLVPSSTQS